MCQVVLYVLLLWYKVSSVIVTQNVVSSELQLLKLSWQCPRLYRISWFLYMRIAETFIQGVAII